MVESFNFFSFLFDICSIIAYLNLFSVNENEEHLNHYSEDKEDVLDIMY